jgi:hypothetical protein
MEHLDILLRKINSGHLPLSINYFLNLFIAKPRRPLSKTERQAVEHHFKDFLKQRKIPGKTDCQRFLIGNPRLRDSGRDWKVVKYFMHNKIMSIKRNLCQ